MSEVLRDFPEVGLRAPAWAGWLAGAPGAACVGVCCLLSGNS